MNEVTIIFWKNPIINRRTGGRDTLLRNKPHGFFNGQIVDFYRFILTPEIGELRQNRRHFVSDNRAQFCGSGNNNWLVHNTLY